MKLLGRQLGPLTTAGPGGHGGDGSHVPPQRGPLGQYWPLSPWGRGRARSLSLWSQNLPDLMPEAEAWVPGRPRCPCPSLPRDTGKEQARSSERRPARASCSPWPRGALTGLPVAQSPRSSFGNAPRVETGIAVRSHHALRSAGGSRPPVRARPPREHPDPRAQGGAGSRPHNVPVPSPLCQTQTPGDGSPRRPRSPSGTPTATNTLSVDGGCDLTRGAADSGLGASQVCSEERRKAGPHPHVPAGPPPPSARRRRENPAAQHGAPPRSLLENSPEMPNGRCTPLGLDENV